MTRRMLPLAGYNVLRTTDVDEARASVAASLAPHRLVPKQPTGFAAVHNTVDLGRLSVHYIDYGADVEVAVDGLDFHLVQIPLAGTATISSRATATTVTPRSAVFTRAGEPTRMRYSSGTPRLMVRIAAPLFDERTALAQRDGLVIERRFGDAVDIARGRGRGWRGLLDVVIADLERDTGLATTPFAIRALEVSLVDWLVASLADRSASTTAVPMPRERTIRRAARLIDDHCAEPLGTPDIATAVGVSVRALQAGFRDQLGTTPMAYLLRARLLRVREALLHGAAVSVTDAAMEAGLTHLGRLSRQYRDAFGELPGETLRRSR